MKTTTNFGDFTERRSKIYIPLLRDSEAAYYSVKYSVSKE
jgi:hypothetical protein